MKAKWFLIIVMLGVISYLHLNMIGHNIAAHVLHQELFFIPIILASFWFRMPFGIGVAIVVSGIYAFAVFAGPIKIDAKFALYLQVTLYIGIAALIGWLTSRMHAQQKKIVKDERRATLATLASALSFEIRDIVNSLGVKYARAGGMQSNSDDVDFKQEIDRLERLTNAFGKIVPQDEQPYISRNLNDIILKTQQKFRERARNLGVRIQTELNDSSCPSMVFTDSMIGIFESLISNALEVSPRDSEIMLRATRKGTYCSIEVHDHGPGVAEENVARIFTPFFSTKPDGFGLTLSSGRKVMRDHEGDLLFEPGNDGGAIFKMIVPRESRDKNIDKHVTQVVG